MINKVLNLLLCGICLASPIACKSNAQKVEEREEALVCENLSHGKYCFPESVVASSGEDGFLLELPLGVMDEPCHESRTTWGVVTVLFGDYRMPDKEYSTSEHSSETVERHVIPAEGRHFRNSDYEIETCRSSSLYKGTFCTVDAHWNGLRLRTRYYRECGELSKQYSSELEAFLEESYVASDD